MIHQDRNNRANSEPPSFKNTLLDQKSTPHLLLTELQAAKALGISPRTLWGLRNSGKIPHLRIGRSIRYSVEALNQWIDQQSSG